jgi:hypothetical protein
MRGSVVQEHLKLKVFLVLVCAAIFFNAATAESYMKSGSESFVNGGGLVITDSTSTQSWNGLVISTSDKTTASGMKTSSTIMINGKIVAEFNGSGEITRGSDSGQAGISHSFRAWRSNGATYTDAVTDTWAKGKNIAMESTIGPGKYTAMENSQENDSNIAIVNATKLYTDQKPYPKKSPGFDLMSALLIFGVLTLIKIR